MPPKRKGTSAAAESRGAKKSRSYSDNTLAEKCINTIRVLTADVVEKAKSGHPGAPMGCAPMAHLLWGEYMNFSGALPNWPNRDRFVLSNGHACALLYSMLHMSGYAITLDDLKQFRQLDSITPGHPENHATPGVEISTGPLGQGISNAVGLAMAEAHMAATFNREGFTVVNHFTYVICGDGCLQEGVSSEASSLAGHLGLGKLIVLYDDNLITIDGSTELSFTEDVAARYTSYNWHVQSVADVNDLDALRDAIDTARAESARPSLIKIRTVIGHGSSSEGSHKLHGAPLGSTDLAQLKARYGFSPDESFVIPDDVRSVYASRSGGAPFEEWATLFAAYSSAHPYLAEEFTRRMKGELPTGWKDRLPRYPAENETKAIGTRNHSEQVLNALAGVLPEIMGGSADLTPSNLTSLKCCGEFQRDSPDGRYVRFGVREHGMAAICNGLYAYGGLRPFGATFLNFIGYALGSVRLTALSRLGVIYVMTHDSIGLGEDGPTHQPVEMLESLRAMPNMLVFRPADGNEVCGSYICAVENPKSPSVIALSRQVAPAQEGSSVEQVAMGAYTLCKHGSAAVPSLVLVATGTEVQLAVNVAKALAQVGATVSVVSMPCWELFERQLLDYQREVFPVSVPVMSIEAAGVHGWTKYAHASFGLNGYGLSAPGGKVLERFGFTVETLLVAAQRVMSHYENQPVPSLVDRLTYESSVQSPFSQSLR